MVELLQSGAQGGREGGGVVRCSDRIEYTNLSVTSNGRKH